VTEELRANGFTVETLDWTDPEGGPHVWLVASASTELSADAFFAWVHTLVDEPSVFIVEGGPIGFYQGSNRGEKLERASRDP
jgi:hypothetical protein